MIYILTECRYYDSDFNSVTIRIQILRNAAIMTPIITERPCYDFNLKKMQPLSLRS